MHISEKLIRRDGKRRFQVRKLRRLLECDDSSLREIAGAIDALDGLSDHLRRALPREDPGTGRTEDLLCRVGLLRAEKLIKRYFGRTAVA